MQQGDYEMNFNPALIEQAVQAVQGALATSSSIERLQIPVGNAYMYVSRDGGGLIAPVQFLVDGTTYYLGVLDEDAGRMQD